MSTAPQPLSRAELSARLGLLATPGLRRPDMLALLRECGSAVAAYRALDQLCHASIAAAARTPAVRTAIERALALIRQHDIRVLAHDDPAYPTRVRERLGDDVPPLLFLRGRAELLERAAVAIVGSRNASLYGRDVAEEAATAAARAGVCVVSGLARGIDATAHAAALAEDGDTVAVLGCGVDVSYPPENHALQARIAVDGLLVSEFLPGTGPRRHHFPYRNRIIAALARALLVVEAQEKSGALTTADHAAGTDVKVYCVPHAMHDAGYAGLLKLLREGATLYTGMRDLLIAHGLLPLEAYVDDTVERTEAPPTDPMQARLWQALGRGVLTVDDLFVRAGIPPQAGATALLALEMDARICRLPGQRVRRARNRDRAGARRRSTARNRTAAGG